MKTLRWSFAFFFVCWSSSAVFSQAATALPDRIQAIMSRPASRIPASECLLLLIAEDALPVQRRQADGARVDDKLLTEFNARVAGGDYRFHTRVYRPDH